VKRLKALRVTQDGKSLVPQGWVLKAAHPLRINSTRKTKGKDSSEGIVTTQECLSVPIATTIGTINS
jgi:hypothetical protein